MGNKTYFLIQKFNNRQEGDESYEKQLPLKAYYIFPQNWGGMRGTENLGS